MGMTFTMENQVSRAFGPADINGTGVATGSSDWLSMANYDHLTFFININTHGAASTITVANASSATGTGTADIAFNYRLTATTLVDDFGAIVAATSAGVATDGATVGIMYAIEIDSSELTDGMSFVQVKMSDPSAAMILDVVGIGSRGKNQAATGQTLQS